MEPSSLLAVSLEPSSLLAVSLEPSRLLAARLLAARLLPMKTTKRRCCLIKIRIITAFRITGNTSKRVRTLSAVVFDENDAGHAWDVYTMFEHVVSSTFVFLHFAHA